MSGLVLKAVLALDACVFCAKVLNSHCPSDVHLVEHGSLAAITDSRMEWEVSHRYNACKLDLELPFFLWIGGSSIVSRQTESGANYS